MFGEIDTWYKQRTKRIGWPFVIAWHWNIIHGNVFQACGSCRSGKSPDRCTNWPSRTRRTSGRRSCTSCRWGPTFTPSNTFSWLDRLRIVTCRGIRQGLSSAKLRSRIAQLQVSKYLIVITTGVHFINTLRAAFTHADPNSTTKTVKLSVSLALLGSALKKAVHIMLMKLTQGINFTMVLRAAFAHTDPKAQKDTDDLTVFFLFWDLRA